MELLLEERDGRREEPGDEDVVLRAPAVTEFNEGFHVLGYEIRSIEGRSQQKEVRKEEDRGARER